MMTLQEAARVLGGVCHGDATFTRVGTDSRKTRPGDLFVALRGERFDGHAYLAQAAQDGAAAALVDAAWAGTLAGAAPLPLLVVEDTRLALGRLAADWRGRFAMPLIGVTGSNGKTTVKNMCAAILRAHAGLQDGTGVGEDVVLATDGNFNNDIGLPLTLLRLRGAHRSAVIEMGMNHPGELRYLAGLARPTVAVVTNAQRAHLLGMGTLSEVAREKGEIYAGLVADGVAVINADDPHAAYWQRINEEAGRHVVRFGMADAAAEAVEVQGQCTLHGLGAALQVRCAQGAGTIRLQVPGLHNAHNALAAAAACLSAGVPWAAVVAGLEGYTGTQGRLTPRAGAGGSTVLDDTYNANPDSVRAGIDVLAATPGRKILVLGDMGEIGTTSAQVHDEIGGYAKSKGVDALYAIGEMSAVAVHNFGEGARHFRSPEALADVLVPQLDAETVVLVKGSRFMRMERVVECLAGTAAHAGQPDREA